MDYNYIITTKNIPTDFITINNNEINLNDTWNLLNSFELEECLNNYNVDVLIADILVGIGVLKIRTGERQATLYFRAENFDGFYDYIYNIL